MSRKESDVQRAILDALQLQPGVTAYRTKSQGTCANGTWRADSGIIGIPDISGYFDTGRALFIEVKSPCKCSQCVSPCRKGTKAQIKFIQHAQNNNCVAGFACSVDMALEIINQVG